MMLQPIFEPAGERTGEGRIDLEKMRAGVLRAGVLGQILGWEMGGETRGRMSCGLVQVGIGAEFW